MARRKRPPKAKTEHITGLWVQADAPYYHVCCECALTHHVQMKLEDGKVFMKWDYDAKETAHQRRVNRFDKAVK